MIECWVVHDVTVVQGLCCLAQGKDSRRHLLPETMGRLQIKSQIRHTDPA
jgi:hypothetical protein